MMHNPDQKKEESFLSSYDVTQFERPSVTVDHLIFTFDIEQGLSILLVKRNDYPFKNAWALPGGFIQMNESLEEAANRILLRETGMRDLPIEQLYTFGDVGRDPRTRVISVAYYALLPSGQGLKAKLTENAAWFQLSMEGYAEDNTTMPLISPLPLAFDHNKIIETAIERLRGKITYTDLAFSLLKDKNRFAIYELQKIYEAILGKKLDTPNFRRMFTTTYLKTEKVVETGEKCTEYPGRSSRYYQVVKPY